MSTLTFSQFVTELSDTFIPLKNTYTLDDNSSLHDISQNIVRECHNGLFPQDIIYNICQSVISDISECCESLEDLEEFDYEYTGSEVNNYQWYTFPHFESYCQDAIDKGLASTDNFNSITESGLWLLIQEISSNIKSSIADLEDDQYSSDEEI